MPWLAISASSTPLFHQQRRQSLGGLIDQDQVGITIRVRHIVSICCSPPDSSPAWRSRRLLRSRTSGSSRDAECQSPDPHGKPVRLIVAVTMLKVAGA